MSIEHKTCIGSENYLVSTNLREKCFLKWKSCNISKYNLVAYYLVNKDRWICYDVMYMVQKCYAINNKYFAS